MIYSRSRRVPSPDEIIWSKFRCAMKEAVLYLKVGNMLLIYRERVELPSFAAVGSRICDILHINIRFGPCLRKISFR
jgi:hypothetical protein